MGPGVAVDRKLRCRYFLVQGVQLLTASRLAFRGRQGRPSDFLVKGRQQRSAGFQMLPEPPARGARGVLRGEPA